MLESFYICLSVKGGEVFEEHYKRIVSTAKILGDDKNEEILGKDV